MARPKIPLPNAAEQFLLSEEGRWCRSTLILFHRFMSTRNLVLSDLTPVHITQFWEHQQERELCAGTLNNYRRQIRKYLYWLATNGLLRFAVATPRRRHFPLPESAQDFVAALQAVIKPTTCHGYCADLRDFYAWLAAQDLTVEVFARPAAERWLKSLADRGLMPGTRNTRKH